MYQFHQQKQAKIHLQKTDNETHHILHDLKLCKLKMGWNVQILDVFLQR